MTELLQKLSTYNIFNYLFPGVVFVILLKHVTNIYLIMNDLVLGMFLYYCFWWIDLSGRVLHGVTRF